MNDDVIHAAAEAVEREIEGRSGGDEFLYGMDPSVRDEFLRAVAEAALSAAGVSS